MIIEAQAAAKSVLVFDAWPMNEVSNPAGCEIVPAFDTEAYSLAMQKYLRMPVDELQRSGESNRTFARRYSWDASASAQESFYQEVLHSAEAA